MSLPSSGWTQIPSALGWYQIPNTQMINVCPPGYDCTNVIVPWSGGTADTSRNRLIVWGGGHGDYAGNEVYALDLNALTINRLNNPSPPSSSCVEVLSDGTPPSRHTYDGLAYIAHADRMSSYSGSMNPTGCGSDALWTLNMSNLQWTLSNLANPAIPNGGHAVSEYDPNTKNVFIHTESYGNFASYNYDTNTLKILNGSELFTNYLVTAVVDPKRRFFFMFGSGGVHKIDISGNDPAYNLITLNGSGCGFINFNAPGAAYDPVQDRIVGWAGGDTVYLYNPDTDSCSFVTYPGGPPLAPTYNINECAGNPTPGEQCLGTYGRFRYFPALNIFALVNDASQNAYALRLTNGTPPPPDTTPPSVPTGLSASAASSAQINLSWNASTDNVGVTSYKVFRCQGLGCSPSGQIATSASTSFQDTGLSAGTTYAYAVSAYDTAGNNSGLSASVSAVTLPISGGGGGITADQDYANRCHAPGVTKCVGMDTMGTYGSADVVRMDVDPNNGNLRGRSDGQYRGTIDTAVKKSGVGSLRFQLDAGYAAANIAGEYIPNTNDGLGGSFGENSTFYVQYAVRFSPEMLSNLAYWDSSWKVSIFHMDQASCAGKELTVHDNYNTNRLTLYKDCGAESMYTLLDGQTWTPSNPPLLEQQGDYYCDYGGYTNCWNFPTNTWITMYFKVHVGNYEQPNSTMEAWYAVNGQPYVKWINVTKNFTIHCNGNAPCPNEVFNNLSLLTYMTGLTKSAPATAYTWYDELIVSTQPIAAPGGAAPPPDTIPPSVPTNLAAVTVSSSQVNLNWTASTDNVGVAGYKVFRCLGAGCAPSIQIAAPTSNSFQDTGLTASTTYTYTVSAFDTAGNVSAPSASASAVTLSSSTVSSNLPPVVSAIGTNATDVDPATPGLQIYDNTSVTYSGSASDPNGGTITWQWLYTTNGGAPVLMASGTGTVQPLTFNYPAGIAPKTYVWILSANNGVSTVQQMLTVNVIVRPSNPPPADAKPGLRSTLVFPNPTVNQNPTIRAFLGQVASVEITIFDASGQVVHSASLGGSPTGISNGQYYYDYIWSGKKSSGIYFAVIHGKAADGTIIRARTKFAVIR